MGYLVVSGVPHIYVHVCAYMLKIHVNKLQMANNMSIMINICLCACVHICVHAWGSIPHPPSTTPTHPHPPLAQTWWPTNLKNAIHLEQLRIIQFFFKTCELWELPHLWLGVWVGGYKAGGVGWWVGLCQITKNQINLKLIKIIQFCLKIYDLLRYPHLWWVIGWVGWWAGSC